AVHHAVLGSDLRLVTGPEAQNEAAVGQIGNGGGGHCNRWRGADEDAADAGAEPDTRGPCRAGRQDRELVAAMTFGNPGRLVTEALSEDDEVDDVGGVGAARNRG